MSIKKASFSLNLLVVFCTFIFMLALLELSFRVFDISIDKPAPRFLFGNQFAPYMGFINGANFRGKYPIRNILTGQTSYGQRTTNNWGFRCNMDFQFGEYYKKKSREKIVLITGGSAAAAAGATADDKTIDARLAYYLNTLQSTTKYTVFNFANGGWVAFQEIVGLALFGEQLDPDWIIAMNGRNDIAVCIADRQGVAVHQHYWLMKSYMRGYLEGQSDPVFYRGSFENWLINNSRAYRELAHKKYIPRQQKLFNAGSYKKVGTNISWDDVEGQLAFYLRTQEMLLRLKDKCKYILSLQPLMYGYTETLLASSLEELKSKAAPSAGAVPNYNFAVRYFYRKAHKALPEIAERHRAKGVNAEYVYPGIVFNDSPDDGTFFIDDCHMTDAGQDAVARLYAYKILERDFPDRKDEFLSHVRSLIKVNDTSISDHAF